MDYTIGIDIGGTNFRIGMVSKDGQIENFEKNSSRIFGSGDVIETLFLQISDYIKRYNAKDKIKAVAIGLPSMVSKDKKTVISTPNLKGFDNILFGDVLEEKLGFPIFIDRDVNYLLQNDMVKLELPTDLTVLGFYIGTGFGNAIYLNGGFYCGRNGAAGELGHIPLLDIKEKCTCGNVGCSEVRCSGKYLEALCEKLFPKTAISDVFKNHSDNKEIIKFVKDLAIPIATEINILDPDYIILAGGVIYMQDFPKDILVESIHFHTRKPYPEKNLRILFSKHNQQSGVYGSGNFAWHRLNQQK
ncbi:MAG: allose kinase [Oscillospiraceae bacterium]